MNRNDEQNNTDWADRKPSNYSTVLDFAKFLRKFSAEEIELLRQLPSIDFLRYQDSYQSYLGIKDKDQPYHNIKLKKKYSITDEQLALALGISRGGLLKRIRTIAEKLKEFLRAPDVN